MQVTVMKVSALKFHPRNYRRHPQDQLRHISASIRENGFYRNVVVARDGTVLAGQGVVQASRRFRRPQHVVDWTRFDHPLRRKPDAELGGGAANEYGMRLVQVGPTVKHAAVKKLLREAGEKG
jgi:hypothetical protein